MSERPWHVMRWPHDLDVMAEAPVPEVTTHRTLDEAMAYAIRMASPRISDWLKVYRDSELDERAHYDARSGWTAARCSDAAWSILQARREVVIPRVPEEPWRPFSEQHDLPPHASPASPEKTVYAAVTHLLGVSRDTLAPASAILSLQGEEVHLTVRDARRVPANDSLEGP